ncbi:hypothetical protein [Rhodopila sp.]|uniref:hypothetical protein n=1 Tax=Rhodopila sp. TaxID=2480087 RepID=UPI003D145515
MPGHDFNVAGFADIRLADLDTLTKVQVDALPFGVIGLSQDGLVAVYNATESRLAGLSAESVIGSHFFLNTAQCMNNFLVAQRFEDEAELDTIIDFVLTLRMRPTPVRLRMLKGAAAPRHYILIQR